MSLAQFIKNVHLLVLPSSLWAVHVDPDEFLAIVHVNVNSDKVTINRGVVLRSCSNEVRTTVSINDETVECSHLNTKVETISDIATLVYNLHNVRVCPNATLNPACGKYVFGTDNCCEFCKCETEKKLCSVCGKTFSSASRLDNHMLTHADEKPFKCKVCRKGFAKKYNLNVHSSIHSGERPYVCSKCGKTYSTRSNLSTHTNSVHCKQKRHRCEVCEMSFVHPRVLKIHMRKHTGEKPYMCQMCGKLFAKNIHLTIHTRTHTGEKPYVCTFCGKAFTTTGNLNSHKKINHK